jgi:hypothetical protein
MFPRLDLRLEAWIYKEQGFSMKSSRETMWGGEDLGRKEPIELISDFISSAVRTS